MDMDKAIRVFGLVLPWVWIAAAALIAGLLSRSVRRRGRLNAFAVALAAYGVTDLLADPASAPPGWLLAAKIACIGVMAAMVLPRPARGAQKDGPSGTRPGP